MSYSEEKERGKFVAIALNLQALGAVIGGIIPLLINRNKVCHRDTRWWQTMTDCNPLEQNVSDGVPPAVYATFIAMDFVGCAMAFLLASPEKVRRSDGTDVAEIKPRTFLEELKGNLDALKDWRLWLMVRWE